MFFLVKLGAMVYNPKQEMRSYHISNWLTRLRQIKRIRKRTQEQQLQQQSPPQQAQQIHSHHYHNHQHHHHHLHHHSHSQHRQVNDQSMISARSSISSLAPSNATSGLGSTLSLSSSTTSKFVRPNQFIGIKIDDRGESSCSPMSSAISPGAHSNHGNFGHCTMSSDSNSGIFEYDIGSLPFIFPDFTEFTLNES